MTTVYLVRDSVELSDAFAKAGDGDRIELAAGAVFDGYIKLKDRAFATGLTITSEDPNNPGVFEGGLEFFSVRNVTLTDIDFTFTEVPSNVALFLRNTDNITMQRVHMTGYVPTAADGVDPLDPATRKNDPIIGYGTGGALRVKNSNNILIEDVEVQDFKTGMRFEDITNVTMDRLDLHGLRDGITMNDAVGLTIQNSWFHNFKPWITGNNSIQDHPDMIQYWGKYSSVGMHDITIHNNIFEQGDGEAAVQAIFGEMRGAATGVTATNFTVTNNAILDSHVNTIRLDGVSSGAVIDDNLILSNNSDPATKLPRVNVAQTGLASFTGNIIAEGGVVGMTDTQASALGNLLLSTEPADTDYWGLLLDAWQAGNITGPDVSPYLNQTQQILGSGPQVPKPPVVVVPDVDTGVTDIGYEVGTFSVTGGPEKWHSVTFSSQILDARVVLGALGTDQADPVTVRVRNVTDTGFEFLVDEWNYQDGVHEDALVTWMAASAGEHTMADGTQISAGRVTASDEISTKVGLSGYVDPVVFAQVSSYVGSDTVVTRLSGVSRDGFSVRMQEQESSNGRHTTESVDWIAIDAPAGGFGYVSKVATKHTDNTVTITPVDNFAFLASMQTENGPDTAALNFRMQSANEAVIWVQEEASADAEMRHAFEDVAVLTPDIGHYDLF
ncbi:MAG: right-handed parallel beta-helix repeat-containing protein [Rhodobacteraceae bacterium]|nr:right-handed parallel beta-helix repeat-containing protein [Paracoccaceae bacterium]